ncbi:uncharacterized protein MONBRDRAFT_37167 [Monosiga brevicollis MX1]|uniref:Protein kinase domain-containing protein n=1 Tax=Monosiga brevicollis TaxID=81824 RepID=A9V007_MONBE|nr:uncharacterized protein MONBRDRAFT_37167 [Monosiga brevicollis MX1]EDQ88928.1 predicted protein [Monosiga brevicollis MX1]|eukprot:XP_001746033.1 hypothetical protein [Monosiga brevicollis MX1]
MVLRPANQPRLVRLVVACWAAACWWSFFASGLDYNTPISPSIQQLYPDALASNTAVRLRHADVNSESYIVIFSGETRRPRLTAATVNRTYYVSQSTWIFSESAAVWHECVAVGDSIPHGREYYGASFMQLGGSDGLIVHGGSLQSGIVNDAWRLELVGRDTFGWPQCAWQSLRSTGIGAPMLAAHRMVTSGSNLIVFGGCNSIQNLSTDTTCREKSNVTYLGRYDHSAASIEWSIFPVTSTVGPSPRSLITMVALNASCFSVIGGYRPGSHFEDRKNTNGYISETWTGCVADLEGPSPSLSWRQAAARPPRVYGIGSGLLRGTEIVLVALPFASTNRMRVWLYDYVEDEEFHLVAENPLDLGGPTVNTLGSPAISLSLVPADGGYPVVVGLIYDDGSGDFAPMWTFDIVRNDTRPGVIDWNHNMVRLTPGARMFASVTPMAQEGTHANTALFVGGTSSGRDELVWQLNLSVIANAAVIEDNATYTFNETDFNIDSPWRAYLSPGIPSLSQHAAVQVSYRDSPSVVITGGYFNDIFTGSGRINNKTYWFERAETPQVFKVVADCPAVVGHSMSASADMRDAYIFGGFDSEDNPTNDVYQMETDPWRWRQMSTQGTPPPRRGYHSATILFNSKAQVWELIIFGGTPSFIRLNETMSDLFALNLETFTWRKIEASTPPGWRATPWSRAFSCTVRPQRSLNEHSIKMLIAGGRNENQVLSDLLEYDHSEEHWERLFRTSPYHPTSDYGLSAQACSMVNGSLVIIGGATMWTLSKLVIQLDPYCNAGFQAAEGDFGSSSCLACPQGKYRSGTDDALCTTCPVGITTESTGSTSSYQCNVCEEGRCAGAHSLCTVINFSVAVCDCGFGRSGDQCSEAWGYYLLGSMLAFLLIVGTGLLVRNRMRRVRKNLLINQGLLAEARAEKEELEAVWEIERNDLKWERNLDEGGFGNVYLATWLSQDKRVAVKCLKNTTQVLDAVAVQEFAREIRTLRLMRHRNIVFFYGACNESPCLLVMEFVERGSLADIIKLQGANMPWERRLNFMSDAASGMQYLHLNHKLHMDLKSGNCLVSSSWTLKLTDFATTTAVAQSAEEASTDRTITSLCWCAPELFAYSDAASPACDVYSYGILCWEILQASTPPYMDLDKPWKIRDFVQGGGRPSLDEGLLAALRDKTTGTTSSNGPVPRPHSAHDGKRDHQTDEDEDEDLSLLLDALDEDDECEELGRGSLPARPAPAEPQAKRAAPEAPITPRPVLPRQGPFTTPQALQPPVPHRNTPVHTPRASSTASPMPAAATVSGSRSIHRVVAVPDTIAQVPVSASTPRRIPGPLGLLPPLLPQFATQSARTLLVAAVTGQDVSETTPRNGHRPEVEVRPSSLPAWQYMEQQALGKAWARALNTNLVRLNESLDRGKIGFVVARILSVDRSDHGCSLRLHDDHGQMLASLHPKLLNAEYGDAIADGAVLVLRDVTLYRPRKTVACLNITQRNLVTIFWQGDDDKLHVGATNIYGGASASFADVDGNAAQCGTAHRNACRCLGRIFADEPESGHG